MDARIVPTEKDFFVGKCQSCRYSEGVDYRASMFGASLVCVLDDSAVKPQWQCSRYEYEPGSLG